MQISFQDSTIYTDSKVAQGMLNKQSNYKGTPRLQRWGIELMSFAPHLKIGFRRGVDNGMADLLSRYPYFRQYIPQADDVVELPPGDLYDRVAEAQFNLDRSSGVRVKLTVSQLVTPDTRAFVQADVAPRRDAFELCEYREECELDEIWQHGVKKGVAFSEVEDPDSIMDSLTATLMSGGKFRREEDAYEQEQTGWTVSGDGGNGHISGLILFP